MKKKTTKKEKAKLAKEKAKAKAKWQEQIQDFRDQMNKAWAALEMADHYAHDFTWSDISELQERIDEVQDEVAKEMKENPDY